MSKKNMFNQYVIPPGETIKELLEVNGMKEIDLVNKTGINIKTINGLINGETKITPSISLKLENVFKIPASLWNNLESNYRESLERSK